MVALINNHSVTFLCISDINSADHRDSEELLIGLPVYFTDSDSCMCRYCWPVSDKKQEQQFRRVCSDWLTEIAKDDDDAYFPRIVASIFLSPGGDKFYQLLMAFTRYVMVKQTQGFGT